MSKTILLVGTALLILAVIFGAFGAHALKEKLSDDMMQVYKTGVEYHFYHALGLILVGILAMNNSSTLINWSACLLFAGVILFSGSLYALAITEIKWLGIVTPVGGVSFIIGWALLFLAILKNF